MYMVEHKGELNMKLSNQALGAVMMALQNSLIEQSDIVPVLKGFELQLDDNNELVVLNPPTFKAKFVETTSDEEFPQFVSSDS